MSLKNPESKINQYFQRIGFLHIPIQVYYYENDEGIFKKSVVRDFKNFSIEKIEEYNQKQCDYTTTKKNVIQKNGKDKGKKMSIDYHAARSYFIKHVNNLYILDIDCDTIETMEDLIKHNNKYQILENSVYKNGNTKGIHIFLFINDFPGEYSNQTKILDDTIEGDLLKDNNLWVFMDKYYEIHNTEKKTLFHEWDNIKHLFDVQKMNFKNKETISIPKSIKTSCTTRKNVRKTNKKPSVEESIVREVSEENLRRRMNNQNISQEVNNVSEESKTNDNEEDNNENVSQENVEMNTQLDNNKTDESENNKKITPKYGRYSEEYIIAKKCINSLSIERITNYDSWIKIMFCLFNSFEENIGFKLFDECSQRAPNYGETWEKWEEHKRNMERNIEKTNLGLGSLIHWAKEDDINFVNGIDDYYKVHIDFSDIYEYNDLREKLGIIWDLLYSGITDYKIAQIIYSLYPQYFVSCGTKILYFINKYGIYIEQDLKNGIYVELNIIFDCVVFFISKTYNSLLMMKLNNEGEGVKNEESVDEHKTLRNNVKEVKKRIETQSHKKNIISALCEICTDRELLQKLDEINPHLIGFENGVFDIEKKIFRKATINDYISKTTGYFWKPFTNDNTKIMRIQNIFQSFFRTQKMAEYILKNISFMSHGSLKHEEQFFQIFEGIGGNGKSLLANIIRQIYGQYVGDLPSDLFVLSAGSVGKAMSELAQTKSQRFVFVSEPETGNKENKLQVCLMKKLSGNDMIQTRELYQSAFRFLPRFTLIFLLNTLPELSAVDTGFTRRIEIVNFPFIFRNHDNMDYTNPDCKLSDASIIPFIQENKSDIFNYITSFFLPHKSYIEEVQTLNKEYVDELNPYIIWFRENYEITNNDLDGEKLSDIIIFYYTSSGDERRVDSRYFSKMLKTCGVVTKKKKDGLWIIKYKRKNIDEA